MKRKHHPDLPAGVYLVRGRFLVQWCARGRRYREKLPRGATLKVAVRLRERRLVEAEDGRVPAAPGRVTFETLMELRRLDAETKRREHKTYKHLDAYFRGWKADRIDRAVLQDYVRGRQAAGAADATIEREGAALRRGFCLAIEQERLVTRPSFKKLLNIDNVVRGFFSVAELDRLLALLPAAHRPAVAFAGTTGWRRGEVFGLTWDRVDFGVGECRVTDTKNGLPRAFPFDLAPSLVARLRERHRATGGAGRVFDERGLNVAWRRAVGQDGLDKWFEQRDPRTGTMRPVRPTFHGLRHTAAQQLYRAGVDKQTIQDICGWETASMFKRYTMTDEAVKRRGVELYVAHLAAERAAAAKVIDLKRAVAGG